MGNFSFAKAPRDEASFKSPVVNLVLVYSDGNLELPLVGFSETIQGAVDLAANGNVLVVFPGTYTELISVDKNIEIRGANYGINPNTGVRVPESILSDGNISLMGSSTVTIDGFHILQTNVVTPVSLGGSGVATIQNTIIERVGVVAGSTVRGIEISNGSATKNVLNNKFTGDVSGGLFGGHKTWNSGIFLNGPLGVINIENNVFENCRSAINLDDMGSGISLSGNVFQNSGSYMSFGGTVPTTGSYVLGANEFKNPVSTFVNLSNVSNDFRLDISAGTFNETAFSTLPLATLYAIESTMFHRTRSGRNGLVYYVPNNQYVLNAINNNIQTAISYAASGDIINVQEGTFTQSISIAGKNGLQIKGSQAGVSAGVGALRNEASTDGETILDGTITTGSGTSGWPIGFTIDGFRLVNTSFVNAIRVQGDVTITNCIVFHTSTYFLISVAGNPGTEHTLTLTNSNVNGTRGFSIENGRVTSATIQSNVFNTTNANLVSASAMDGVVSIVGNQINGPRGVNILSNGNTITRNIFNLTPDPASRGIDLYEVTGNTIAENMFSAGATSINVVSGGRGEEVLGNTITNNALLGGINNQIAKIVEASCNWFGSDDFSVVEGLTVGEVNALPFITDGTDSDPGTIGFQPTDGSCEGAALVQRFSDNTETILLSNHGTIQGGIDASVDGNVLRVLAGTYTESISVDKNIEIRGANYGINPNTGVRVPESILSDGNLSLMGSSTVTIDGFHILQTNIVTPVSLGGSGVATIQNTIIERVGVVAGSTVRGIEISNGSATKNVLNNKFTGDVSGGLFGGHKTWNSGIFLNGPLGVINIENNVFENCRSAINLDDMGSGISLSGNVFQNSGSYLSFGGTVPTTGSYVLGANEFKNPVSTFVNLSNVSNDFRLDISAGTFNETAFSTLPLATLYAIESTMFHRTRSGRNGLVYYVPNNQYVLNAINNNIQTAISYAASGDVINVQEGTFVQDLLISKNLDLRGANYGIDPNSGLRGAETIIQGTSASSRAFQVICPNTATNVFVDGFRIEVGSPIHDGNDVGNGPNNCDVAFTNNLVQNANSIYYGQGSSWKNVLIRNNLFQDINATPTASALSLLGGSLSLTVSDNVFNNMNYSAISVGSIPSVIITGNSIDGTGNTGIQLANEIGDAIVQNNLINNANNVSQAADRGAIRLYGSDFTGEVRVMNNKILGGYSGIAVREGEDIAGKDILISENSISGLLGGFAIYNGGANGELQATCNWFGTSDFGSIESLISGDVNFIPFLTNGTNDEPDSIGFYPVAGACSSIDLTTGLAGHWRFEEGSGAVLEDFSGNGNNATLQNLGSVSRGPGVVGDALFLPGGTNRFAIAPHSPSLNITGAITISAWIRPNDAHIRKILTKTSPNGYDFGTISDGRLEFALNRSSNPTAYRLRSNGTYPSDGTTWMHVVATFDGTVSTIYINGVADASETYAPVSIGANTSSLFIGSIQGGGNRWNGGLDDLRLYGRALTPAEVLALYTGDAPNPNPPMAPQLAAPEDGLTGVQQNTPLAWQPSIGAVDYRLQVSLDPAFGSTVADINGITGTSSTVPGLLLGTEYFWRVLAGNAEGDSDWSDVWSFTTIEESSIDEGLAGHWRFEEGSGNILEDYSGNGNNAVLQNTGSVSRGPGVVGDALFLPGGTNRFGLAPNSPSLNITGAITISAWIRPNDAHIRKILTKTSPNGYDFGTISDGRLEFALNRSSNPTAYRLRSNGTYPSDGSTWMHVAATFDGSVSTIYINGEADATATYSPFLIGSNTSSLFVGSIQGGGNRWNGGLDEVRLYNRALSASEIETLYSQRDEEARKTMGLMKGSTEVGVLSEVSSQTEADDMLGFVVYPNPVKDKVFIQMNVSEERIVDVAIFDLMGRQFFRKSVMTSNGLIELDLVGTGMVAGTYLLLLDQGQVSARKVKLIKK